MVARKEVTVEVVAVNQLEVGEHMPVRGWGDDGTSVEVTGRVAQILIKRNGEASIGFSILENGSIIVTGYDTSGFSLNLSRNVRLENDRPWEDDENHQA